jgi:hypothetical protein
MMLNIISVGLGIALFVLAMILFWKTYLLLWGKRIILWWLALALLTGFFFLGYIGFEIFLITGKELIGLKLVVSQVFLWGAVFVLIVSWIFYNTGLDQEKSLETSREKEEKIKRHALELERVNKFLVGRELDMIELKKEVNGLLKELGREPKYK